MAIQDWLLVHGSDVLMWVLTAVGGLVARWVAQTTKGNAAAGVISRALTEVGDAVMMVGKTYVSAIKAASADGTLTPAEKDEAKAKAIAAAKKNLGAAGLKRLAKVLGADVDIDHWLGTKLESAVAAVTGITGAGAKPSSAAVAVAGAADVPASPQ